MNATIFGLLSETSVHPGAGQSTGFVDLPVAREKATDYPVVVGTSVKGALRDRARREWREESDEVRTTFGVQENAGTLLVSDARLLLLPVRSLTSSFKWVTSPHLIERFVRDTNRASKPRDFDAVTVENMTYLGTGSDRLFLEEREFRRAGDLPAGLAELLMPLIRHSITQGRLAERLVVVSDDDFGWFARFGLSVNARNNLDPSTKESKNLWYEETIPPDSLFYFLAAERGEGAVETLRSLFEKNGYLQLGGNETVGQGWFAVQELN